jgi:hypothetical protein
MCVLVGFHYCVRIFEKNNSKEEIFIFLTVSEFPVMVCLCFWACGEVMVVGVCGQEGWSPHGIQEAIRARGNRKWCEQDTPFKGKPPVT